MRYIGCSHDRHFHHLYQSRDRRIFTTDDVTFVETDVQIPDFSGNMELELAGLHDITPQDKEIVDAYSERDNKVDWEQRALTRIDPDPQDAVSLPSATLDDPHQLDQQCRVSPSKLVLTDDDDAATDPESVFGLYGYSFSLPSSSTSYASCYDAGGDPESFARGRPTLGDFNCRWGCWRGCITLCPNTLSCAFFGCRIRSLFLCAPWWRWRGC